jgi:hypothetical protein
LNACADLPKRACDDSHESER